MPPIMAYEDEPQRQLLVVRHGERCDFTFNGPGRKSWVKRAFDSSGRYCPFDINLPRNVPRRSGGWEDFETDTPLTEMGYLQSKLIGRALRDQGVQINYVYCSSALRCIQTTVGILKGLGLGSSSTPALEMNIEPGLYEWMAWCRHVKPSVMDKEDLLKIGYPINESYKAMYQMDDLRMEETYVEYYKRSHALVQHILKRHPTGSILLVGHSASLEVCTRQLCGGDIRPTDEFLTLLRNTPYLGTIRAIEHVRRGWELAGSPVPPLTHTNNHTFDPFLLDMTNKEMRERASRDPSFIL